MNSDKSAQFLGAGEKLEEMQRAAQCRGGGGGQAGQSALAVAPQNHLLLM